MIKWLREKDTKRLVHCEDASRLGLGWGPQEPSYYNRPDLYSVMYYSTEQMETYANDDEHKLPFFHCEYAHTMGNGPGDVGDYMEMTYKYPKLIGGCIWEWADHTYLVDGVPKYGGDFDELTNFGNFCMDGLVFYDRSFKAGTVNVKYAYQNVRFELEGDTLKITNLFDFTNLNEYWVKVDINVDGRTISTEKLKFDILPKAADTHKIVFPKECRLGAYVVCRLLDCEENEIGLKEIKVLNGNAECYTQSGNVKFSETDNEITAAAGENLYTISKNTGEVKSIKKNGAEKLVHPLELTVWRAD